MRYSTGLLGPYLALRPSRPIIVECFTLALASGTTLTFNNADVDVPYYNYDTTNTDSGLLGLGNLGAMVLATAGEAPTKIFKANSLRIEGLKFSCKIGVDIDEQEVRLVYRTTNISTQALSPAASSVLGTGELGQMNLNESGPAAPAFGPTPELIDGVPVAQALQQHLLDMAELTMDWVFLYDWGPPGATMTPPPIGTVTMFQGLISTIDKVGRTEARVKVRSGLAPLSADFPRNIYQPSCYYTLFDTGCTLIKASYATSGTVGSGSTDAIIYWSNPASQANTFQQGQLVFTSGDLNGYSTFVKSSTATTLMPVTPFPLAPQPGDGFTVYPGCDHTTGTDSNGNPSAGNNGCQKFGNLAHFPAFTRVPPPATAL